MSCVSRFMGAAALAAGATLMSSVPSSAHISEHDRHTYHLDDYADFIMNMRLPGNTNSCCGNEDAIAGVKAIPNESGSYTVTVPKGTFGLGRDVTFDVPKAYVLTAEQALKICDENPQLTTCAPPNFTILWISSSSLNSTSPSAYCFWYPLSFSQNLQPDNSRSYAADKIPFEEAIELIRKSRDTMIVPASVRGSSQSDFTIFPQ